MGKKDTLPSCLVPQIGSDAIVVVSVQATLTVQQSSTLAFIITSIPSPSIQLSPAPKNKLICSTTGLQDSLNASADAGESPPYRLNEKLFHYVG